MVGISGKRATKLVTPPVSSAGPGIWDSDIKRNPPP
jgi:hypothetical protein